MREQNGATLRKPPPRYDQNAERNYLSSSEEESEEDPDPEYRGATVVETPATSGGREMSLEDEMEKELEAELFGEMPDVEDGDALGEEVERVAPGLCAENGLDEQEITTAGQQQELASESREVQAKPAPKTSTSAMIEESSTIGHVFCVLVKVTENGTETITMLSMCATRLKANTKAAAILIERLRPAGAGADAFDAEYAPLVEENVQECAQNGAYFTGTGENVDSGKTIEVWVETRSLDDAE
jgi:hypothetical protein